jgi:hypothetical protein
LAAAKKTKAIGSGKIDNSNWQRQNIQTPFEVRLRTAWQKRQNPIKDGSKDWQNIEESN